MTNKRMWLILALLLCIVLSPPFISTAYAHGGTGVESHGPAAPWMIGLIYLQLLLIPVVGVWLVKEVLAAWRPRRNLKAGFTNRPRDFPESRKEAINDDKRQ